MPLIIEKRPDYKGSLILVQVPGARPGVCVKMTEEEAIARGWMAPRSAEEKKEEPARNKARRTSGNKTAGSGQ